MKGSTSPAVWNGRSREHCPRDADWQSAVSPVGNRPVVAACGLPARDTADCQPALFDAESQCRFAAQNNFQACRLAGSEHDFVMTHVA
jgi:hypothetical protein